MYPMVFEAICIVCMAHIKLSELLWDEAHNRVRSLLMPCPSMGGTHHVGFTSEVFAILRRDHCLDEA